MLTNLLTDDKELITYRKSLNQLTGGPLASILLQQILYWASQNDWEPFYKFKEPCKHKLYKEGTSWTEELGFSRKVFDSALKKIATKVTKGTNPQDILFCNDSNCLVLYWTDRDRVTHYQVNLPLLERRLQTIYS